MKNLSIFVAFSKNTNFNQNRNLDFNPEFSSPFRIWINFVCHSRESVFRVLGIYNFGETINLEFLMLLIPRSDETQKLKFARQLLCFIRSHISSDVLFIANLIRNSNKIPFSFFWLLPFFLSFTYINVTLLKSEKKEMHCGCTQIRRE